MIFIEAYRINLGRRYYKTNSTFVEIKPFLANGDKPTPMVEFKAWGGKQFSLIGPFDSIFIRAGIPKSEERYCEEIMFPIK